MNVLNNKNKGRYPSSRRWHSACSPPCRLTLASCDDDMDINNPYPFTRGPETMPRAKTRSRRGQTVNPL